MARRKTEVGDEPGVLDPIGLDSDFFQALLELGSQIRFGMGAGEKFAKTVTGQVPGFEGQAPTIPEVGSAQRALSVASGTERFGPIIPTLMSLFAVENPAIFRPESAQATSDALASVQSGEFQNPQNQNLNLLLRNLPGIGGLLGTQPGNFDAARMLLDVLGQPTR